MPDFDIKDLLQAVGPTASLIFAAWIFLSYLQTRYTAAYQLFRELVAEYRDHSEQDTRRDTLRAQVLVYKRRCELMRRATNIGTTSAIVLICALIAGVIGTMYDMASAWKYLTAAFAIVGLLLVIWAASLVIVENVRLKRLIELDMADLDLPDEAGRGRQSRAD